MTRSAYVHIPFCRRRCFYCDFAISVVGDHKRGNSSRTISRYIETLIREINATPVVGHSSAGHSSADHSPDPSLEKRPQPLETVFFGGGTPSLLEPAQVERILATLDKRFGIASTAEISMEMDPATFELDHAQGYKAAGINRVSLGAQAFQDELLAAAGRFHRREDITQAVRTLQTAGFENISLDLISGLPHQTMAHWEASLQAAIALTPTHLSIYDLIVEPQTAFARYYTPGEKPLPSDRTTAEMYTLAQQILTGQGYSHYEICNFAQPGYEAQHNLTYWRCEPNYGFGMGATSYLPQPTGPQRIDRPRTQATYRDWVEKFIEQAGKTNEPTLPPTEQVLENIMMGLRLKQGISLESVNQVFGEAGLKKLSQALTPHIQKGWIILQHSPIDYSPSNQHNVSHRQQSVFPHSHIRLSDPYGFLMSNVVITDAFNAIEAVTPLT